jgi:L-lactate dehydrogenase (cytochrome)/(S)-mandelate dehydrogenase
MESWARYAPAGASATDVVDFFRSQSPSIQTWRELDEFRSIWPGKLLLKGIQHPEDAARSESAGIDGVIVSNHGGKSFDPLPSPLATLPAVKAAVGGRIAVMLDSGIRRGSDILVACALGADFTFVGRAALYGVVAGGERGALRAIEMLKREVDLGLALVGSQSCRDLSTAFLLAD